MKLDEMTPYMRDGDSMSKGLFETGVSFLSDKERSETLQKTDGALVLATRSDATKIIKQCQADLDAKLLECHYPGCKQIADPVVEELGKFQAALEKGSWKGPNDAEREHLINLYDLLIIKSVARRDSEKALATMEEIVVAERQRQIAMGIVPEEIDTDGMPVQKSSTMKWILIIAAVVVVLLVLGIMVYYFTKAAENLETVSNFQDLLINRVLNQ